MASYHESNMEHTDYITTTERIIADSLIMGNRLMRIAETLDQHLPRMGQKVRRLATAYYSDAAQYSSWLMDAMADEDKGKVSKLEVTRDAR